MPSFVREEEYALLEGDCNTIFLTGGAILCEKDDGAIHRERGGDAILRGGIQGVILFNEIEGAIPSEGRDATS